MRFDNNITNGISFYPMKNGKVVAKKYGMEEKYLINIHSDILLSNNHFDDGESNSTRNQYSEICS